jgi:hypothetical protein
MRTKHEVLCTELLMFLSIRIAQGIKTMEPQVLHLGHSCLPVGRETLGMI